VADQVFREDLSASAESSLAFVLEHNAQGPRPRYDGTFEKLRNVGKRPPKLDDLV